MLDSRKPGKRKQVKVVEFDARQSTTQQQALLEKLRQQGWSVRSVELGPSGMKRLHLVRVPPRSSRRSRTDS